MSGSLALAALVSVAAGLGVWLGDVVAAVSLGSVVGVSDAVGSGSGVAVLVGVASVVVELVGA